MKINLRKILKKIATLGFSAVAVAATAGTALIPSRSGTVNADNQYGIDNNMWSAVSALVGGTPTVDGRFHTLGTYGVPGGTGTPWSGWVNKSRDQMMQGMDCARSSMWILHHYLLNSGVPNGLLSKGDSAFYVGDNLAGELAKDGFTKVDVTPATLASSIKDPGTLILYGHTSPNTHTAVYLGGGKVWSYGHDGYAILDIANATVADKGYGNIDAWAIYSPGEQKKDITKSITITKQSANPGVTGKNPNYSLAGAVFDVYNGENTKLGSMTTGADGKASFSYTWKGLPKSEDENQPKYTLHAVEQSASKGFKVAGGTYKTGATVPEPDRNDPVSLQITKNSDDGDVVKHPKELKDAEFTLRFYAVDPNTDESKLPSTPTRTWTLTPTHKVNDKSTNDADAYRGYLYEAKGDALYKEDGLTVLPIGILTVQETKAPNGYKTTENKFIDVNNKNLTVDSKGVVTMRIFSDNSSSGASINFGHQKDDKNNQDVEYDVKDKNVRQGIKVIKYDYDMKNQKPQGNAPDLRAHFVIINDNDYGVASIDAEGTKRAAQAKGDVVYDFETDKDGSFTSNNDLLPTGNYIIKETAPPKGYTLHGNTQMPFSVTDDVTQDKKIIDLTGVQKDNAITDKVIRGTFKVQKNDLDLGTNTPQGDNDLSGKYALINRSANVVWVDTNGNGTLDDNEHFAPGDVINNRADATKNDPGKKIAYTFDTAKDGTYDWGEVQAEFPVKRAWYFKWKYSWRANE